MVIYKYALEMKKDTQNILLSLNKILSVGLDAEGTPCMWAEVDPARVPRPITLHIIVTGAVVPPAAKHFIGTIVEGRDVQHIYLEA